MLMSVALAEEIRITSRVGLPNLTMITVSLRVDFRGNILPLMADSPLVHYLYAVMKSAKCQCNTS